MNTFSGIDEVRTYLGQAVFIGFPWGSKGAKVPWKQLTAENMTREYLASLNGKNIGVVLGAKSGDLIVIDLDLDELVEPFLEHNPLLRDTLQTRGSRGRVFWLRMGNDQYPDRTVKLKTTTSLDGGEFRSNGAQSIIHGLHPAGSLYTVIQKARPLTITFDSIRWPTQMSSPIVRPQPSSSELIQSVQSYRVTDAVLGKCVVVQSVEESVQLAIPQGIHQSNAQLFHLGRALKSVENYRGNELSRPELVRAFDMWFSLSKKFLRTDQSRDDYMTQFINAYASAKVPLGQDVVQQAWRETLSLPIPKEAREVFKDPDRQRVVSLCRQLQLHAGSNPFFLSCRRLQALQGDRDHIHAARTLKALCVLGILEEVTKGSTGKASRFRYLGSLGNETDSQTPS